MVQLGGWTAWSVPGDAGFGDAHDAGVAVGARDRQARQVVQGEDAAASGDSLVEILVAADELAGQTQLIPDPPRGHVPGGSPVTGVQEQVGVTKVGHVRMR
ncbi:hypothetical protein [Actinomadura fibrosa]|uniref:Uncharacterized protein n=1 Tax=Actinomadura fibrosa TaxID=111802 RepID=A0ABW2XNW9_9ACTN|nr:hypothetical protein [Actinomadura fibrosa]